MRTLVIGGGVTGLLAAWHLQKRGQAAELWEAEDRPGGWVQTLPWDHSDGRPGHVEKGPQGILWQPGTPVDRVFKGLDLAVESPVKEQGQGQRWVGKGGRLIPVPAHPVKLMTSPLMSLGTKLRLFREPFVKPGPPEPEEGLEEFISRRAGRGLAEELLPAMVAGILAAPTHLLSVDALPTLRKWESHGSLFAGVRKNGVSHLMVPQGGMGGLTARLAASLPEVQVARKAERLERLPGGRWRVWGGGEEAEADQVVLALPAYAAAELLAPHAEASAEALRAIPYTSVNLWNSRHTPLAPFRDGFGFLIHPPEGNSYLGSLVPSWIEPSSCAPEFMQLRSFIGDPHLWGVRREERPTWEWVWTQIRRWVPGLSEAVQTREDRAHQAIPRAEKGHRGRVRTAVEGLPQGIEWISNARFGPGVRDVMEGLEAWVQER
ncbi:MAG: protoporphyrinogen oxidase [Acidobacteria bacterium]|nr:protoporphyrinogen oxidase [Acidobacteriota bacterium]